MTEVEKLGLKMGQFKVTGPSGKVQIVEEPVEISVRAYSDCTNDPMKVLQGAAGIQTVCLFTAVEKKGEPVDPTASN